MCWLGTLRASFDSIVLVLVHAACFIQWSEFQRNQVRASYSSRRLKRELIRDFPGSEITEENIDAFLKEAVANGDFGLPYIG